jgi:acyl-coenzyme A synthetase/AMP-(fatty) acid ligase
MDVIPLIAHTAPDNIVAYRRGRPIQAARFLADVSRVAALLPVTQHLLNACRDRYNFAVGLAAGVVSNRVNLLPSTHTPDVIRHVSRFAPDAVCLTDDPSCEIELPLIPFPDDATPGSRDWCVTKIPTNQCVAYVFTSGTTGEPVPHAKTWGRLVRSVRIEAERLGINDGRCRAIVATVPPQHMYGFETTVLLALQNGHAIGAERPFYPADIATSLATSPAPRVLVSTPIHLRTLIASDVELPPIELFVSATAPLAESLARDLEARFGAPVLEIYGATETGQIASRRTTETAEWWLWPDVRIENRGDQAWVLGSQVEEPTPMGDILEVTGPDRFLLHGREADLVIIAGKRSSLAYLNHQLTSIPGVLDGAFFWPDDKKATPTGGVSRLAALVVAPTLDAKAITKSLRERLDPAFLPRPLLIVPEIRRNATGKLPRHVLQTLLRAR